MDSYLFKLSQYYYVFLIFNIKNSVYNVTNGRYVLGGITEVSTAKIEWWTKTTVPGDPTDLVYFMEKQYEGRPDILGYVFYGDSSSVKSGLQESTLALNERAKSAVIDISGIERRSNV